jgi:O-antigen/teichoic acid export membrane protein
MLSSLHRNSLWLLFARLTAQGLAILFIAVTARRLGIDSFGQFAFIAAVILIGNTFTNFGTDTYIIRELGRSGKVGRLPANALSLQLLLSTLWVVITFYLRPDPPLILYSLVLLPLTIFSIATATLRAFERMDLVWTLSLANGIIQLIAALLSFDLWTLCLFLLIGQLVIAVLSYWICFASISDFSLLPLKDPHPLFKLTLPFAVLTVLLVVSQRLGVLSVSTMLGDAATGIFSSASRVVDGLKIGHYAVLGALLPVLSRRTMESKVSFRNGFVLLMVLSFLMAIGLSMFSRIIIFTLYGNSFSSASNLLPLLGWSLIPYTISSFISYDLIARRHENALVRATAVSLGIFIFLFLWLVSSYNLQGAIFAVLIGETIQAIVLLMFRRSVPDENEVSTTP